MWNPDFDSNNYTRWERKGLIVRLRRGWFAFPECLTRAGFTEYAANRIYQPSYVSLHTALAFYGMIPEAVADITSVTTLKTSSFDSTLGRFCYQTLKPSLFFGFELKSLPDGRTVRMATPEKALLDLLYLYPAYDSADDMLELRLDDDFLESEFDRERLEGYIERAESAALRKRADKLIKAYGI